jgi:hypothetical protein
MLTYSSILCTTYNSPLAMSITGNVKDVASTVLGAFLFPGFEATAKNVGGLTLSFVGAATYSYINLKKGMRASAAAAAAAKLPADAAPHSESETSVLVSAAPTDARAESNIRGRS